MKTKKIAAIAASGLLLTCGAWAQGWMSGSAQSGAGYATPGTTQFNGTVSPVVTPYNTMGSGSSTGSAAGWSSNAAATSGTSSRITGYVPPDQTPVDRAEVQRQASAFARLRANASGEDPSYPVRQQLFLGTAPGSERMQATE